MGVEEGVTGRAPPGEEIKRVYRGAENNTKDVSESDVGDEAARVGAGAGGEARQCESFTAKQTFRVGRGMGLGPDGGVDEGVV